MTIHSTITVQFGDKAGLVDVSDRATGAQAQLRLNIGDFGTHRAQVTLLNNDGALTPGGGGTYTDVDWLAQGLFISGDTGSYTYQVFHGIITDFKLVDDGVNSTVVLEADDAYVVGGGSSTAIDMGTANPVLTGYNYNWIEYLYNGFNSLGRTISGVPMPLLGNAAAEVNCTPIGVKPYDPLPYTGVGMREYTTTAPARDFLRTSIMPAALGVGWPTTIDVTTTTTIYESVAIDTWPIRYSTYALEFAFDETAASGELPFARLRRGFPIDSMINETRFTSLPFTGGATFSATAQNTTSLNKYGSHAFAADTLATFGSSEWNIEVQADLWANTFSDGSFTVESFEISEALVNATVGSSATSEQAWAQLLDITTGPLQLSKIRFTPTGSVSQVEETFVTLSRTIQITTSDVRIALECLPITRVAGFVLDSDVLGVLDTNRLG